MARPIAACRTVAAIPAAVAIVIPDRAKVRNPTLIRKRNTMTHPTPALSDLAETGAGIDVLRPRAQFTAQRQMEIGVDGRWRAGRDEKSPEGLSGHSGYRDRTWDARAGSVELKMLKLRQLLPGVLRAPEHGTEDADGGHSGWPTSRVLDALCGRAGQGAGRERRLHKPGQPPVASSTRVRAPS